MNFYLFQTLKANGVISEYEIKQDNGEVWLYIDGLGPGEVKSFNVDLVRQYEGKCIERPQSAYEFYN